uniref:Uncharacterized protein n=1 Tax=Tetraselmis chuii TaxID=63592 RepID=A0A7S1T2S6_9CHLO|mmetsp:Transcript_42768/g.76721  ORF Transcript_42768/g.76721 Transcript_42768/m.76721 type:complete len:337 (+) Transcript_42768:2148-3158(+)
MLWDSAQSTWKKLASTCMLLLIIFANISSKMLTSVYAAVFYHSNQLLWTPILGEARAGLIANTAVLVYLTIYILFVSVHVKRVGKEDTKFCEPLWVAAYVTGAIGSFLALAALPLFFVRAFLLEVDASSQAVAFTILFLTYGTFLLPLIRSAYMCPRTFLNALHPRVFICWTLSAPTLIGLLHSFALARVADLTWGNRPGGEGMVPMHPDTRRQKHACYCSESGCNEEPLHGSNICREHAWLSQQARKLHGINAIVVAANVTMALTMSYLGTALPSLRPLMYQMLVLFSIVLFIPLLFTEVLALIHDMWAALRWISCAALQCIWCCRRQKSSTDRG